MTAQLQRVFIANALACLMAWIGIWYSLGLPKVASSGALLLISGYWLILTAEFVSMALVSRRITTDCISAKSVCVAWCSEMLLAPRVFCWRQPFRSNACADNFRAHDRAAHGVVLIHGLWCNRGFWNPWMKQLHALEIPFVAINLEPVYCSIDDYSSTIDTAIRTMRQATGRTPIVVGHSMGGLAARAWLGTSSECASLVHRLVTIGTPHRGTWLAGWSHAINGKQMRLASPWLAELSDRELAIKTSYQRMTCFYSDCDNIVFPSSAATLPGADNRLIRGAAHVELAFRFEIFLAVTNLALARNPEAGSRGS